MAKQRSSLTENMRVSKPKAGETSTPRTESADMKMTTIHIEAELLTLLRMAAVKRAEHKGGRPSVSDVVRDLLGKYRAEIEAEANQ